MNYAPVEFQGIALQCIEVSITPVTGPIFHINFHTQIFSALRKRSWDATKTLRINYMRIALSGNVATTEASHYCGNDGQSVAQNASNSNIIPQSALRCSYFLLNIDMYCGLVCWKQVLIRVRDTFALLKLLNWPRWIALILVGFKQLPKNNYMYTTICTFVFVDLSRKPYACSQCC